MSLARTASIAGLLLAGTHALAGEKSAYSLMAPVPDHLLRDMSTDRPDKTESPFTVDAGRLQIETDLVGYTRERQDGMTTETVDILPFNVKVGLTDATDMQVIYGAYSRTRRDGAIDDDRGFGDVTIRLKHNLWGNDGGWTAVAVMPFVKLPANTLEGLDDSVDGGLIVPLAFDVGHGFGVSIMSEVDMVRSADGRGYVPTFIQSATLAYDITDNLGLYTEAYVERSTDDAAHTIVTFDTGLTYAVTENLQLDAGANIGVTDTADDLNVFVGMSRRY